MKSTDDGYPAIYNEKPAWYCFSNQTKDRMGAKVIAQFQAENIQAENKEQAAQK